MTTRYVDSAAAGANNGTSKTDAYTTFAAARAAMSAGDTILVNSTHVEPTDSTGSAVTLNIPGTVAARSKIVSVNFSTDVPTQGAALYTTSGATPLIINGVFRIWGCNLSIGSGAVTAALTLCNTNTSVQLWQSCNLTIVATGGSSNITIGNGSTGGPMLCQWSNVTATFGATGQGVSVSYATTFSWRNDSGVAALGGATYPAVLFKNTVGSVIRIQSLDLNMYNSGRVILQSQSQGEFEARNCRVNPGSVNVVVPSIHSQLSGLDFINCKDGATPINDYRARYMGIAVTETTIVRTAGATSGSTAFSWKISPNSNNSYDIPFVAFETALWNTVLTAQTLTIHVVTDNLTLTDAEIWVQVEYPSSASYPLTSVISDRASGDPIPAAASQAADSGEAWTTTGLTTPNKQKLNVTFTAAMVGPIRVKVVVAKTSGVIYVCPKADLA
jgi:hypothetical protein